MLEKQIKKHWLTSSITGAFIAAIVLVVGLGSVSLLAHKYAATTGTFRTADLIVDHDSSVGHNETVTNTITQGGNQVVSIAGAGLSKAGATLTVNIAGATCAAGQAVTSIGATGTGVCGSAAFTTNASVYYADGSDGTCNFDGVTTPVCGAALVSTTYTLARDIAPLNMTVATGVTVREDNFRVMVFGTLTGGGAGATISNAGFPGGAGGDPRLPGQCGGSNSHYYQACNSQGGAGANGTGGGNNGGANAGAIPQWAAQAPSAAGTNGAGNGQGGGGGSQAGNAGGTGGSIANPSVNVGYYDGVGGWSGRYDSYGNQWNAYGTGGGGGGCTGGACVGGGGGGGGGMTFVSSNQCAGTLLITAAGGDGHVGTLGGGTGAGGGAGGGGGVITFMYSHKAAGCTTSVAGGTGAAAVGTASAGGNGSSGTAQLYNFSGDGS